MDPWHLWLILLIRKVVPLIGPLKHCWAGGPSAGHSFDPPSGWCWTQEFGPNPSRAAGNTVQEQGWGCRGRAPDKDVTGECLSRTFQSDPQPVAGGTCLVHPLSWLPSFLSLSHGTSLGYSVNPEEGHLAQWKQRFTKDP